MPEVESCGYTVSVSLVGICSDQYVRGSELPEQHHEVSIFAWRQTHGAKTIPEQRSWSGTDFSLPTQVAGLAESQLMDIIRIDICLKACSYWNCRGIKDLHTGYAGGVNQLNLHGYTYSGPYADFPKTPGWEAWFYLFSDAFGPRQPLWEYIRPSV